MVANVVKNLKDVPTQVLLHQCDCCRVLPITKTRFTMDEEGYDIDLCQECYQKGISYAIQKHYNPKIPVLVDNGQIYITQHDKNLSCYGSCERVVAQVSSVGPSGGTFGAKILFELLCRLHVSISGYRTVRYAVP